MGPQPTNAAVAELLQHSAWMRRLAQALVRDEALADDLVQETWVAALRSPPRGQEPVRPWLSQVLRNVLRMRFRSEGRRARREEAFAPREPSDDCEHLVEAVEMQRLLAEELLALGEPYRSTLLLRYYEGLSAAEIANRQKLPAATVRWRVKQGLDVLRGRLDRDHKNGSSLRALLPLAGGRSAVAGIPWAASAVKGVLVVKASLSIGIVVAVVGGALLIARHRSHSETRPPAASQTAAAGSPATASSLSTPQAATGSPTSATVAPRPRLDEHARAVMLARIEAARHHATAASQTAAPAEEQPLDKDYIREQIRALLPQIEECYNNALHGNPKLEGTMVVDFSIVGDPSVGGLVGDSKVNADKSSIGDADMRECVQETMYAAQFRPPTAGGEVKVTYPFVFKTADDDE